MILLLASPEPDWTYHYQGGKLWKNDSLEMGDTIEWTEDIMVVCGREDVICWYSMDHSRSAMIEPHTIEPWSFLGRAGILNQYLNPQNWAEVFVRSDVFRAIDTYDSFGGYGGLSLDEYVGRLYRR